MSVLAASAALGSGRSSRSLIGEQRDTLLVTLDPLTPTSHRLGVLSTPDTPIAVTDGLHVLALDRLALLERTWAQFSTILAGTVAASRAPLPGVDRLIDLDPAELIALPGIEDFLLLRRVRDEAVSGQWRRIVLDCSGGAGPFVLLRSASTLHQAINRFWPRHRRIAAAADRPALAPLTAAVDAIDHDCSDVAELLADPTVAPLTLVIGADDRGESLLPHQLAATDAMGLALRSVVFNTGVGNGDPTAHLERMTTLLHADEQAGVVLRTMESVPGPIDRAARLRRLGGVLDAPDGRAHGSSAAQVRKVSGNGTSSVFEMCWRQRLPDPDGFALGRVDDDLLITVDGFRHPVRLPSVLRRCVVADARWDGEHLRIEFVPDPAVWPADR